MQRNIIKIKFLFNHIKTKWLRHTAELVIKSAQIMHIFLLKSREASKLSLVGVIALQWDHKDIKQWAITDPPNLVFCLLQYLLEDVYRRLSDQTWKHIVILSLNILLYLVISELGSILKQRTRDGIIVFKSSQLLHVWFLLNLFEPM